jgi:hypothetical protein
MPLSENSVTIVNVPPDSMKLIQKLKSLESVYLVLHNVFLVGEVQPIVLNVNSEDLQHQLVLAQVHISLTSMNTVN